MSTNELTTINKHPIRKFDVVETDQGNIAIVKELSSLDECSLSYLHEVPPGTTFAWWPQRKLKFLWNVADEHFKRNPQ